MQIKFTKKGKSLKPFSKKPVSSTSETIVKIFLNESTSPFIFFKMPAGVSWSTYLKHLSVAMIFMMAGAQSVHLVYRPLENLDDIIENEKTALKSKMQTEEAKEKLQTS